MLQRVEPTSSRMPTQTWREPERRATSREEKGEHARGEDTKDLRFDEDIRSNDPAVRTGREQKIYDQHPEAKAENGGLNKRNVGNLLDELLESAALLRSSNVLWIRKSLDLDRLANIHEGFICALCRRSRHANHEEYFISSHEPHLTDNFKRALIV